MLLIINTTPSDYLAIILADKNSFKVKKIRSRFNSAEMLVPAIDKFIKSQKLSIKKLSGIGVVTGPGGFTGVRSGVAVANALGWSLNLPIAGLRTDQFSGNMDLVGKMLKLIKDIPHGRLVMPYYDRAPNITLANQ